jgi:hypothetical protein
MLIALTLLKGLRGLCLLAAQARNLGSSIENPELNNPNQQFFDKQAIHTLHTYVLVTLSYFCVGNKKFSPQAPDALFSPHTTHNCYYPANNYPKTFDHNQYAYILLYKASSPLLDSKASRQRRLLNDGPFKSPTQTPSILRLFLRILLSSRTKIK